MVKNNRRVKRNRKSKEVFIVEESLKNELVKQLIEKRNLKTSTDISDLFLDLQSRMYECLLETELDIHLQDQELNNKRNGYVGEPRDVKTKMEQKLQ